MRHSPSIVPENDHDIYFVLNDFGLEQGVHERSDRPHRAPVALDQSEDHAASLV
jgi:hypothetical protein